MFFFGLGFFLYQIFKLSKSVVQIFIFFLKLLSSLNDMFYFLFNKFELLKYCFYIQHISFILLYFNITSQRFLSQVNSPGSNPAERD